MDTHLSRLKSRLKGAPVVGDFVRALSSVRQLMLDKNAKNMSAEDVFNKIFKDNIWGSKESISGHGSDRIQTRLIVEQLPSVLKKFNVTSLLDIPCGDFHWMQNVDFGSTKYIGADIVLDLIQKNQIFADERRQFVHLDLLRSPLPKVDMIFCRDCLVHLSFDNIAAALQNIIASGSTYLMTTTFPARTANVDIVTGRWRPLNLQKEPFHFPEPDFLLEEGCTEHNGAYADKSLAVWRVASLAKGYSAFKLS